MWMIYVRLEGSEVILEARWIYDPVFLRRQNWIPQQCGCGIRFSLELWEFYAKWKFTKWCSIFSADFKTNKIQKTRSVNSYVLAVETLYPLNIAIQSTWHVCPHYKISKFKTNLIIPCINNRLLQVCVLYIIYSENHMHAYFYKFPNDKCLHKILGQVKCCLFDKKKLCLFELKPLPHRIYYNECRYFAVVINILVFCLRLKRYILFDN